MAREKATITVDRMKLDEARALTGAASASATIDLALAELIRVERTRRDVEVYLLHPLAAEEVGLAHAPRSLADLDDGTDWDGVYADG